MILLVKEKQKIRYKTNKNDKTQTHKRRLNQINNKKNLRNIGQQNEINKTYLETLRVV